MSHNNIIPGEAEVKVKVYYNEGENSLTIYGSFTILPASLSEAVIQPIADQVYAGGAAIEPAAEVKLGNQTVDASVYDVVYENNVNVGEAKVTVNAKADGNYSGNVSGTFAILPANFSNAQIAKIADQPYTGSAIKPTVKVTFDGITLKAGRDYEVKYEKNKSVGTATVRVTGKGNYSNVTKTVRDCNVSVACWTVSRRDLFPPAAPPDKLFRAGAPAAGRKRAGGRKQRPDRRVFCATFSLRSVDTDRVQL